MIRTLEVLRVFLMHQGSEITTIVEDHVERLAPGKSGDGLLDAP